MLANFHLAFLCLAFVGCVSGITVEERLNELERIIALQSETLSQHESVIREQRDKLETVLKENERLKTSVESLESLVEQLTSYPGNDHVDDNVDRTKEDKQSIDRDIKRDSQPLNHVMQRKFGGSHLRRDVTAPAPETAAFHARRTDSACVNDNEIVVYGAEEIDVGSGYNNQDGIYTVPITGVFVFTWTSEARSDCIRTDIMVNGHSRGTIEANGVRDDELDHATGVIVTHVNAGDHVFIKRHPGCPCVHHDSTSMSTFSGWLLF